MLDRFDHLLIFLNKEHEKWDDERQEFIHDVQDIILDFIDKEQEEAYYDSIKD